MMISLLPKDLFRTYLSRSTTKPTKWFMRPAKTQISLGIRPVWSEHSLCALWIAKNQILLHADSEDSDKTGLLPILIWVVAGAYVILLVLSCFGSFTSVKNDRTDDSENNGCYSISCRTTRWNVIRWKTIPKDVKPHLNWKVLSQTKM